MESNIKDNFFNLKRGTKRWAAKLLPQI